MSSSSSRGAGGGRRNRGGVGARVRQGVIRDERSATIDRVRKEFDRIGVNLEGRDLRRYIPLNATPAYRAAIENKRQQWSPTVRERADLESMMAEGLTAPAGAGAPPRRRTMRIVSSGGVDPGAIALTMLYHQTREGSGVQRYRYTLTVNGMDNAGNPISVARLVDPSNTLQMLAFVAASVGGEVNRDAAPVGGPQIPLSDADTALLGSDPEMFHFAFMADIVSVEITAIPIAGEEPAAEEEISESGPGSRKRKRGSGGGQNPGHLSVVGGTFGSFFRYYVPETFPDSLADIQVYKRSETATLVQSMTLPSLPSEEDLPTTVETLVEIPCLANSFLMQGFPPARIQELLLNTRLEGTLAFPSSKMKTLAISLKVNIHFTTYHSSLENKGPKVVKYYEGEEGDPTVYRIARLADHYVPDIESKWNLAAIRGLQHFREVAGDEYANLSSQDIQLLQKVCKKGANKCGVSFHYMSDRQTTFATYGQVVAVLMWGWNTPKRQQPSIVTPMRVDEICLHAEIYLHFEKMLKTYRLPVQEMSDEDLNEFVEKHSRAITKTPRELLNVVAPTADTSKWGWCKMIDNGKSRTDHTSTPVASKTPKSAPRRSFRLIDELYQRHGSKMSEAWAFKDKHVVESGVVIPQGGGKPPIKKLFDVPVPYTFVMFDVETCTTMKGSETIAIMRYFQQLHRGEGGGDNTANAHTLDNDDCEATAHAPYCVSVAYVVDRRQDDRVVNFRTLDGICLEEVDEGAGCCFGEQLFIAHPYLKMVTHTFNGFDCMIQLSVFLGSSLFNNVSLHLMAHNARYDLDLWVKFAFPRLVGGMFTSASKMKCADLQIQAFPTKSFEEIAPTMILRRPAEWEVTRKVYLQCTLSVTGIPLSKFASTFSMKEVKKEYMPYSLYNLESLFIVRHDRSAVPRVLKPPSPNLGATVTMEEGRLIAERSLGRGAVLSMADFTTSVVTAGARLQTTPSGDLSFMDLWKYAKYYCEMDCEVMFKGMLSSRKAMYQGQVLGPGEETITEASPFCKLKIEGSVSTPQLAYNSNGMFGVFDGVYEYCEPMMSDFMQAVVGGRTSFDSNSPIIYHERMGNGRVNDWDVTSLYPSAMVEMCAKGEGLPLGAPKIAKPPPPHSHFDRLPDCITADTVYYFVRVRVKRFGRFRRFPILSASRPAFAMYNKPNPDFFHPGGAECMTQVMGDSDQMKAFSSAESILHAMTSIDSTRHFSNHPEGIEIVMGKVDFEDMITFHEGAEVEILYVYYWDQGGNKRLGEAINSGFNTRLKAIAEGKKAMSEATKLKLNASYGRMAMKPIKSKNEFVEGKAEVHRQLAMFSATSMQAHFIREDLAVVERKKDIFKSYNSAPSAAMILAWSKRPMNRVMCLAEDLYDQGVFDRFGVFYTDTDSIHLLQDQSETLFRAYSYKYGEKKVIQEGPETVYSVPTKTLGCFASDFAGGQPGHGPLLSKCFIGVGKKVYYDELISYPKEDEREESGAPHMSTHKRMKGVPGGVVEGTIEEEGIGERELYERLYLGYAYSFDLAKHMKVCFKSGKDFTVRTNTSFTRMVRVSQLNIIVAHMEWVKSGHSYESYPYHAYGKEYFGDAWREPYYRDWIRWDVLSRAGRENLHSTCSNPGHLVTIGELYARERNDDVLTPHPPPSSPISPPSDAVGAFPNLRHLLPRSTTSSPDHRPHGRHHPPHNPHMYGSDVGGDVIMGTSAPADEEFSFMQDMDEPSDMLDLFMSDLMPPIDPHPPGGVPGSPGGGGHDGDYDLTYYDDDLTIPFISSPIL